MEIPTYEQAQARVVNGSSSHLDWFIVENEPGGFHGTEKFRKELAKVIDEVIQKCHEDGKGAVIEFSSNRIPEDEECDAAMIFGIFATVAIIACVLAFCF